MADIDNTQKNLTPDEEVKVQLDLMHYAGVITDEEKQLYHDVLRADESKLEQYCEAARNEFVGCGLATRETFIKMYGSHIKRLAQNGKVVLLPAMMEVDNYTRQAFNVSDEEDERVAIAEKLMKSAEVFTPEDVYNQFGTGDVNSLTTKYREAAMFGRTYDYDLEHKVRGYVEQKPLKQGIGLARKAERDLMKEKLKKGGRKGVYEEPVETAKEDVLMARKVESDPMKKKKEKPSDKYKAYNEPRDFVKKVYGYNQLVASFGHAVISKLNT